MGARFRGSGRSGRLAWLKRATEGDGGNGRTGLDRGGRTGPYRTRPDWTEDTRSVSDQAVTAWQRCVWRRTLIEREVVGSTDKYSFNGDGMQRGCCECML